MPHCAVASEICYITISQLFLALMVAHSNHITTSTRFIMIILDVRRSFQKHMSSDWFVSVNKNYHHAAGLTRLFSVSPPHVPGSRGHLEGLHSRCTFYEMVLMSTSALGSGEVLGSAPYVPLRQRIVKRNKQPILSRGSDRRCACSLLLVYAYGQSLLIICSCGNTFKWSPCFLTEFAAGTTTGYSAV